MALLVLMFLCFVRYYAVFCTRNCLIELHCKFSTCNISTTKLARNTFYLHSICLFWMHSQQIHLWHLNLSTGIKEVCSFSVRCTCIPADWLHTFGIPQDFRSFPGHPGPLSQEHFHSSQAIHTYRGCCSACVMVLRKQ